MADYIEPTQDEFDEAEAVALDVMSTGCKTVMTKTGSAVRELIVRPMAYLYAWATANLEAARKATSVSYLKTSSLTENEIADDVASNYFVTRNSGTAASGVIAVTLSRTTASLQAGSVFVVDGYSMITEQTCVITTGAITDKRDGVLYITAFETTDETGASVYMANIPVVASSAGELEIAAGASVTVGFNNSFITKAELVSAITGGSSSETDAELMERCRTATAAAGIGSYNGLHRKLDEAPVTVLGMSVVAGDDKPLFRARYNNTNINPGGFVDCSVKTQKQLSTGCFTVDLTDSSVTKETTSAGTTYTFTLPSGTYDGFLSVSRVYASKTGSLGTFSVVFGSSDALMDADGARLSVHQTASVSFVSAYSDETLAQVYVEYMPSIALLQAYMDSAESRFIGQDVCVKAAVAVPVSMQCVVSCDSALSDDEFALLRSTIVDYINELPVGRGYINFSDLRVVCSNALSKADLRLPCEFTARLYFTDGTRDVLSSSTGVLDIQGNPSVGMWNSEQSFFCTTEESIRIEQL